MNFQDSADLSQRFVIECEVGRGGVGVVYRAKDRLTGGTVALKVIAVIGVDPSEEERFQREGRLLASITHPNIVRVVAFGQLEQGHPFIAMEWLEGEDLAKALTRPPLSLSKVLRVMAEVTAALTAAHAVGVVHRDVKPSNIFVLSCDVGGPKVKLVDFGVAMSGDVRVTRTGMIVGTPAYMAPEQARGDVEIDARADLYALGATMFELLTGRPPHIGPTPIAILARLVTTPAPRLSDVVHDVPPALDDLLFRLLATHPMDRPSSASQVADELALILGQLGEYGDLPLARTGQRAPPSSIEASSHGTAGLGGSRFVTTLVATSLPKGPIRDRLLTQLRARGAEATELGGDAVVAHLGVRKAVGDEAVRAIELGLRMAKADAKVGVATGRARVEGARPTGDVVDRAAALARDADKGVLLADTMTVEMSRGRFELQLRSDGSAVVGEPLAPRRDGAGGVPFFGREAELSQIVEAFDRSIDDKTPVVVSVCGVPGLGKTRLRSEVLARIGARPSSARVVSVRCAMFAQGYPFGVAAELVRHLAGAIQGVSLEQALEMADSLVPEGAPKLAVAARDVIARLIANEPWSGADDARSARDALFLGLTELLVAISHRAPLVVCIEDAQWADADSLLWMDHVQGRALGKPLFLFLTARPSIWRDHPGRFDGRDHLRIELRPLAKKTIRAIAIAMLGERSEGPKGQEIVDAISVQAAGSPLFAEELARLALRGQDATSAPTLEAALQVHLDSLEDSVRDATIRMSVFGVVLWDRGALSLGVPDATKVLRELAAADIVVEQASSRFAGTREWAFKHALMREVAYASFGDEALKEAHLAAGLWLASVGDDPVAIARHLELGGDPEHAAVYLEKAARRALLAHALSDAVAMAEKSLAFATDKPSEFARAQILEEAWSRLDARAAEHEVAVSSMEGAVYDDATELRARGARLRFEDASGGQRETTEGLDDVRIAARKLGLVDEEARAGAVLATRLAFAGELARAEDIAEELLKLADNADLAVARVDAWQVIAIVRQSRGAVGAALLARQEAVRAAAESDLKGREATLLINVGFALTMLGAKDEARWVLDRGISLAQAIGSPGTERLGKMILLGWVATFGDGGLFEVALREPKQLAESALAGGWVPHDRATLGVLFYRGEELLRFFPDATSDACILLRSAAQGYKATKMLDLLPVALGLWAEAERRSGRPKEASELALEAAQLLAQGAPSLLSEAPVFLALHNALVDLGDVEGAKLAVERGLPRLVTRTQTLRGTPYRESFLKMIPANAALVALGETYDLLPYALTADYDST